MSPRRLVASPRPLAALLLSLPVLVVACGTDPGGGTGGSETDGAGSDAALGGLDALPGEVTASVDIDPYACPGGHRCPCTGDGGCRSGFCIEIAGERLCAEPCHPACPEGLVCKPLDKGGVHLMRCLPPSARLCDPCEDSESCRSFGHGDAACVDHGAQGAFCGAGCVGDAQCPSGHVCSLVPIVEGGKRMQCVPAPGEGAAAGSLGVCSCSAAAIAKALETRCWISSVAAGAVVGRCMGKRRCGAAGLTDCDATPPVVEACNGVDDDCDGLTDEGGCDDGQVCTVDACDPVLGASGKEGCVHEPLDGPCDADGSVCTQGDACEDGACVAGQTLACDDGLSCTEDLCHPVLGCTFTAVAGKGCDDGDPCTEGDACAGPPMGGVCRPGKLKACDDGEACTLDGCDEKGGCVHTLTMALACDDGDLCTHTDLCDASGACAGEAVSCDDGNACTVDVCGAAEGQGCSHTDDGGKPCDDGDKCTGQGTCTGSVCGGGQQVVCTTSKACYTAFCDAGTGSCEEKASPSGAACDDGDACTADDICAGSACKGTAVSCDDDKPCTTDACDKQKGCTHVTKADLSECDDGDPCTDAELCVAGVCKGQKKVCDDKNVCTTDTCDPKKGCVAVAADGGACSDGDACTGPDACKGGKCAAGPNTCTCVKDLDCDDKNACTKDTCDKASKQCGHENLAGACEDGDKCTVGDKCVVGTGGTAACVAGSEDKCDDGNACTQDACDVKTGCANKAVAEGTGCDDGSLCTTKDACKGGKCVAGAAVTCTEYKACFINACDAKTGKCAFTAQKAGDLCDDTDKCTTGTTCALVSGQLACQGGGADKCVDGNPCTADGVCDKQKGCVHDPQSGPCDDGDACTKGDACKAGACTGQTLVCDDKDACTVDSCDKQKGCVTAPAKDGTTCEDGDKCTVGDKCTAGKCGGTLPAPTASILAGSSKGHKDAVGELAAFMAPWGLALDAASGDLYVADGQSHRLRKVTADGTTTTIAGVGVSGFADGQAAYAKFWAPSGLAWDGAGNLWVADRGNHRVRKVAGGKVSTLAGSAAEPPLGQEPKGGYAEGKGGKALFNLPADVAWSKAWNGLVVADQGNHRVRLVGLDGASSLIAGGGTAGFKDGVKALARFDKPAGVAVDAQGVIYVADMGNHSIRRVAIDGTVTTVAGSGKAGFKDAAGTAAQFFEPWGVSLDTVGNLLVADSKNHRVRSLKLAGAVVSTLAGTGTAGSADGQALKAMFNLPAGLVADAQGNTWVADSLNARLRRIADPAKVCLAQTKVL